MPQARQRDSSELIRNEAIIRGQSSRKIKESAPEFPQSTTKDRAVAASRENLLAETPQQSIILTLSIWPATNQRAIKQSDKRDRETNKYALGPASNGRSKQRDHLYLHWQLLP